MLDKRRMFMKILDENNNELNKDSIDYELGYLTKKADGVFIYHLFTQRELKVRELSRLQDWFDEFFSKQLVDLFLQETFEPLYDDFFDIEYTSLVELKQKALSVKQSIVELENCINELEK